jgi:hypothetical protein
MMSEPDAPIIYRKGDRIIIECEGRTVRGDVEMASPNGVSLMIKYDGILGGFFEMMPVFWDHDENEYRCLMTGIELKLSRPT